MKTNELNNGIKEVYTKPALEVEEMEVQWGYMSADTPSTESGVTYSAEDAAALDAAMGAGTAAALGCPN